MITNTVPQSSLSTPKTLFHLLRLFSLAGLTFGYLVDPQFSIPKSQTVVLMVAGAWVLGLRA